MSKKRRLTEAQLQKKAAKRMAKLQHEMEFLEMLGVENLVKWINEKNADWQKAPICFHHARHFLLDKIKESFSESERVEKPSLAARRKMAQLGLVSDRIDVCVRPLEELEAEEERRAQADRERARKNACKRDCVVDVRLPDPCESSFYVCAVPASDVFVAAASVIREIWGNSTHIVLEGSWCEFNVLVTNLHLAVVEISQRFPGLTVSDIANLLGFEEDCFEGKRLFEEDAFPPSTSFYDVVVALLDCLCSRALVERKTILSDALLCATQVEKMESALLPLLGKSYSLSDHYRYSRHYARIKPRDPSMVKLGSVYPSVMLEAACKAAIGAVNEYRSHMSYDDWCNSAVVDALEANLNKCLAIAENGKRYGASASYLDLVREMCDALDACDDWCDVDGEKTFDSVVYDVLEISAPKMSFAEQFCSYVALCDLSINICDYANECICEQNTKLLQWIENRTFWR